MAHSMDSRHVIIVINDVKFKVSLLVLRRVDDWYFNNTYINKEIDSIISLGNIPTFGPYDDNSCIFEWILNKIRYELSSGLPIPINTSPSLLCKALRKWGLYKWSMRFSDLYEVARILTDGFKFVISNCFRDSIQHANDSFVSHEDYTFGDHAPIDKRYWTCDSSSTPFWEQDVFHKYCLLFRTLFNNKDFGHLGNVLREQGYRLHSSETKNNEQTSSISHSTSHGPIFVILGQHRKHDRVISNGYGLFCSQDHTHFPSTIFEARLL